MKYNKFAKKLLKMEMGTSLTLKKKTGEEQGVFIRIPSGWVYRYVSRHGTTSCFVPYTDELQFYDDDLHLKPCKHCSSANIFAYHDIVQQNHYVQCSDCSARTGNRKTKEEAVKTWNIQN